MEATIKQNNISTNVSINIASLQSVIICALQSAKQRALASINQHLGIGALTLPRLYRQQLRFINALAKGIEAHPVITDTILWLQSVVFIYLIYMYA